MRQLPRGSASPVRSLIAAAALVLAAALAACGPGASTAPTPSPTIQPTPTPIAASVESPADAASLVIATNPVFAGAIELTPDIIGASTYWEAEPLEDGGYRIVMTVGWGDCQAGCINRRVWTYEVAADGQLELVGEEGDELPSDLPG